MNGSELLRLVDMMHRDRNISKDVIFEGIEAALQLAAERAAGITGEDENEPVVSVHIDRLNGQISAKKGEEPIDPEMLGKAFESLMQSRARHESGAFYTPQAMVERVTHSALLHTLTQRTRLSQEQVDAALRGQSPGARAAAKLCESAAGLRVLDPACGSGAFLVHALEKLAALLQTTGDARPAPAVRRSVLQWRFIDGVAARIDEPALREAQARKDAVRAYELVYAALGA